MWTTIFIFIAVMVIGYEWDKHKEVEQDRHNELMDALKKDDDDDFNKYI